ncbi:YfbU family protein [Candidatus Aalborgicola defluviihabitans]|uniref:YfbU family protein n=1 Tax=Candidatus Aalborgicola defluviihabitans TaxID=3386187 RepID=UPI001EB7F5E9|nr:YfbU family protein [Burkholderiales bacterium]
MPYETPTWTERLILANQFEILAVLRNNNEFALTAQSFRLGHEWLYKKCFHDFLNDMPSADANEVVSILYLFGKLQNSYTNLTDKSGIDESRLKFPGFSSRDEREQFDFAEALHARGFYIEAMGEKVCDATEPTGDMYKRMIQADSNILKQKPLSEVLTTKPQSYSREEVLAILDA